CCEVSVSCQTWPTAPRCRGYASRSDPPSLWTASTSPWPRARCTGSSAPTAPASPPPSGSCWACCAPTADRWRCSAAIRGGAPPACTAVSPTYPATWPCGPPSAAVDATRLRRRLAYVPGDVALWPTLSGGEVIDLLGRLRGG